MTRRLSSIIDEAYVDVKQAVQFTRLVCDFVSGIKKKAESATVLGVSTFADEYFLLPELYNLDARPIKDAAENLIANEKSFMLLIGEATNKNEYARHWLAPVDYVSGDSMPSGYSQTYNRHLILNESNPGLSGIFRTISPGGRTQDAALPEQLEFCSVYVASGDKYGGKCLSQVLKINKVGVSPQLWITERYAQAPNIGGAGDPPPPGILSGITTASAEYYSSINSYKTGADDALVAAELFLAAVNALKQTTSLAATISECDAVLALEIPTVEAFLTAQTGIATIETIDSEFDLEHMMVTALNDLQYNKTDYPNGERIISSLMEYYSTRKPAETSSRRKAFQIVEQFEAGKLVEKKDNPNSTRPSGTPAATLTSGVPAGDAFDKIAQALFDMNAMNEYWAQLGWASAEKATKNNPHVRQLEQVLKDKDLEELITAHDRAVDSMLNIELNIMPPDRVYLDMSPSPFDLAADNTTPPPVIPVPTALASPVLSGSATSDSITLTWTGVTNAVSYKIYRDNTLIGTSAASAPRTYTASGTNDVTLYTFQVTTISADNLESVKSNTYIKNPNTNPPVVTYESVSINPPTIVVGEAITVSVANGDPNTSFTYQGQAIGAVVGGGSGIIQGGSGTLTSAGEASFTVNPVTYSNWGGGQSLSYRYDLTFTPSNRTARVDFNVVDPNYVPPPSGGYQVGDNFPGKGIIIAENVFGFIFGPVGVSTYPTPHQQYNVLTGEVDWRPGLPPTTGVSGNIYLSGADIAYADDYYRPTAQELAIHDQYSEAKLAVIRSFFPAGAIIVSDSNGSSGGGVTVAKATIDAAVADVAHQNGWFAPTW